MIAEEQVVDNKNSSPDFVEEKPADNVVKKEETKEEVASPAEVIANLTAIVVETSKNSLVTLLLQDITKKSELINKVSIKLDEHSSNILMRVVNNFPDALDEIKNSLSEIMKDGKLDSNDLPNLIKLVEKLYEIIGKTDYKKFKTVERTEIAANILKFLMHVLVVEKIIEIDEEKQKPFLEQLDKLIDSCVGLISFTLNKPESCCVIA